MIRNQTHLHVISIILHVFVADLYWNKIVNRMISMNAIRNGKMLLKEMANRKSPLRRNRTNNQTIKTINNCYPNHNYLKYDWQCDEIRMHFSHQMRKSIASPSISLSSNFELCSMLLSTNIKIMHLRFKITCELNERQ